MTLRILLHSFGVLQQIIYIANYQALVNGMDDVLFQGKFNDFQEQDNILFAYNHQIVLKVQLHALLPIPPTLDFLRR
jgi:uncharacterized membrane protein